MATPLLPNFAGDPNSARDILDYLVDPANAGLIDLDTRLTALTAAVALKVEHAAQESAPTSASAGWFWTKASTGVTYYCSTAYEVGEPDPDSKWVAVTDTGSLAMVKAMSQITSPTPQVSLLSATISGFGSDLSISTAEKATVKILYDEMVQRKIEIDLNAVRYGVTGDTDYTDYVTKYNSLVSYVGTTGVLGNLNVATTIASSSDWTTNWTEAITAEGTAIALLRSEQQDLLDAIDGNTDSALAQLASMTADGTISPQEKLFYRREWTRVQDEYAKLSAKATEYAQTGATKWTTLAATYSALTTYLGTTTAVFSNMATDTVLSVVGSNATEWNAKWQSYYADSLAFDNYIDTYFSELLDAQDATLLELTNSVTALASDGIITGGAEKQILKKSYDDLVRLHNRLLYQAAQYSVATPSSYTTAYDALAVHLNTTLDIFSNMATDTTIQRSVFNAKFSDYYFQYDSFTDAVVLAQKSDVDAEPADYQDYKTLVDNIVDDGIVTAGAEKTRFNAIWLDIQATQGIIVAKGSLGGASTVALVAAYDDLAAYIGTLTAPGGGSPNFTIEGEDTAIGVSTFHGKMRAYEAAKAQLESDIIAQLINLQAGNARTILDMNDDGIISVSEKGSLYKDWLSETAEKSQLDAQATLLSITTEKTNMDSAYTTLETFLNGLQGGSGLFADLTIATTLTTPQKDAWDGHWNLFFTTKATLQTTIIATVQGNTAALGTSAFRKDGTVAATGDFNMADFAIGGLLPKTIQSASKYAATAGQLYTEQQARILHEGLNIAHGVAGSVVGTSDNQTLTTKTINADNNSISNIEADNLKAGVIETDVMASTTVDHSTWASTKAIKKAVVDHAAVTSEVHGLAAGVTVVGTTTSQTLTNKTIDSASNTITIDGDNTTISNLEVSDFKSTAIVTTVGATGTDTAIPTEQAVREAIAAIPAPTSSATFAIGSSATASGTSLNSTIALTGIGASANACQIFFELASSDLFFAASGNAYKPASSTNWQVLFRVSSTSNSYPFSEIISGASPVVASWGGSTGNDLTITVTTDDNNNVSFDFSSNVTGQYSIGYTAIKH